MNVKEGMSFKKISKIRTCLFQISDRNAIDEGLKVQKRERSEDLVIVHIYGDERFGDLVSPDVLELGQFPAFGIGPEAGNTARGVAVRQPDQLTLGHSEVSESSGEFEQLKRTNGVIVVGDVSVSDLFTEKFDPLEVLNTLQGSITDLHALLNRVHRTTGRA